MNSSLAAAGAFLVLPSRAWASPSRNETFQLAVIGAGRMGMANMVNALGTGASPKYNARVVAVCDADSNRVEHAQRRVEAFYQEKGESKVDVAGYGDFRELLARKDIDGVIIATPDHWHAINAIAAADAGKHIYLQKPLTYSIAEGVALVDAVRRNNVVLQVGSQQRSGFRFRQACTIIRNNWLGKLKEVEVKVPTDKGTGEAAPMDVPANLDYDMWLGPCKEEPYTEHRVHPQGRDGASVDVQSRPGWLQVERHCLGMVTGWGAHMYDIAQWGIGADDTGPVEVACKGDFPERGLFDVHVGYTGEARYANGVVVRSEAANHGVKFITEDGWVYVNRGTIECSDRQLIRRKPEANEVKLYESKSHMGDFFASAREGKDPICPVEVGHRSNTVCVLHHISMKLGGRKLQWDPVGQTIANDPSATAMMSAPMRGPWKI